MSENNKFKLIETRMIRARELYDDLYNQDLIPKQIELHQCPRTMKFQRRKPHTLLEWYSQDSNDEEIRPVHDDFIDLVIDYHSYYITIDISRHNIIDYPIILNYITKHKFRIREWLLFGTHIKFAEDTIPNLENKLVILLEDDYINNNKK